jgi:hypothetical protein
VAQQINNFKWDGKETSKVAILTTDPLTSLDLIYFSLEKFILLFTLSRKGTVDIIPFLSFPV